MYDLDHCVYNSYFSTSLFVACVDCPTYSCTTDLCNTICRRYYFNRKFKSASVVNIKIRTYEYLQFHLQILYTKPLFRKSINFVVFRSKRRRWKGKCLPDTNRKQTSPIISVKPQKSLEQFRGCSMRTDRHDFTILSSYGALC